MRYRQSVPHPVYPGTEIGKRESAVPVFKPSGCDIRCSINESRKVIRITEPPVYDCVPQCASKQKLDGV